MLTRNMWLQVGFVESIRGEVVDIVWDPRQRAPALPKFVMVPLEGYTGPVWSVDPRHIRCMSIAPVETTWSTTGDDHNQESRQQLPLALRWAIVMYKNQEKTAEKVLINLGRSEATAR